MRLGLDLLFLVPDETGGRETYARELISALFELEPDLTATAFVNRDAGTAFARHLGDAMRVVRVPVSARRPEQWALGQLGLLPVAARRTRVDILHSLANFAPACGPFRRVLTLHDLQYRAVPELLTPARRRGTSAVLEPAARAAHRIITGSAFTRDAIVSELRIPAERIDIVPYGVGARSAPAPSSEDDLRRRHRLGSSPVLLAVASDLPHKNLAALIRALAAFPAPRRPVLVIAGPGTDGPRLRSIARAAGVPDDVRLLGFASPADLEGLYALTAGLLLPSLYEGFGLPVLEAMNRGVPVACSNIPSLNEAAGDAALRFAPESVPAIAGAMESLVGDGELRRRLVQAGRQRAALFDWRRAAEGTLRCYRTALGDTEDLSTGPGRGPRRPARAS